MIVIKNNEMKIKQLANDNNDNIILIYKNINKQVDWSIVFYVEYSGPLILQLLLFNKGNQFQKLVLGMGIFHYLKRILETKYVHKFSQSTMPFIRLFINSFHYWLLFGLNIWELMQYNKMTFQKYHLITIPLFFVFEFLNFKSHQILSNIRKDDKFKREIPKTWGFQYVSSVNYLYETLSFVFYSLTCRNKMAFAFTVLSFLQMLQWAVQKRKRYIQEFKDFNQKTKAIIPFII